jgi:beta-fructofuranosidase
MTVGSGVRHKGGCVLLYRSAGHGPQALRAWEYLHPLYQGEWNGKVTPDSVDSGEMWECPEFFPLGDHHVLIYSSERKVYWVSGHLDKKTMTFTKQRQGLLDGGTYYAPKTQLDARGRRILWGWVSETRSDDALKAAGWAGCISLPRVLGLDGEGNLTMAPADEVQQLRGGNAKGTCFELQATLTGTDPKLTVMDDATQQAWLEISVRGSGTARELVAGDKSVPLPGMGDVGLRMFVDASVVDIFANGYTCLTVRVYRPVAGTAGIVPDPSMMKDLKVWPMRPISANRLTA